jgi:hypothetical protein
VLNPAEFVFALLMLAVMLWREKLIKGFLIASDSWFWLYVAFMVVVCYYFGVFAENQFIYFQF